MTKLTFYFRPSDRGEKYPGRLCLRLTHHRQAKNISSPYKLYPDEWDAQLQNVIIDKNNPSSDILEEIGDYVKYTRRHFEHIIKTLSSQTLYTVDDIYALLCPTKPNEDSFTEYAANLARQLFESGRERTARAYRSTLNKLMEFVRNREIKFADITISFVKKFEENLKTQGKNLNTISFYLRNLRAIYNKAVEEEQTANRDNLFRDVYTGIYRTSKRALNTLQMRHIHELSYGEYLNQHKHPELLEEQRMYKAWRLFTFCFYARGMCFVDLAYLRKDNIRGGVIRYYRKKTGGFLEVKVTPFLQSIIDSFSHDVRNSPFLFPVINVPGKKERLQYETGLRMQNRQLKKLAQIASIEENLSTHVSRHTWASIAKGENFPLWVISEGLGHSNEKTTYNYLAQLDRSRLDIANEVIFSVICKEEKVEEEKVEKKKKRKKK